MKVFSQGNTRYWESAAALVTDHNTYPYMYTTIKRIKIRL